MSDIICVCGHKSTEHFCDGVGCMHIMDGCTCELTPDTVEARYWARRMWREREERIEECVEKQNDITELKAERDRWICRYDALSEELEDVQHGFEVQRQASIDFHARFLALENDFNVAVDALLKYAYMSEGTKKAWALEALKKMVGNYHHK